MPSQQVPELVKGYDRYLRRRGRSAATRLQYSYPLRSLCEWIGDRRVGELNTSEIELFLSWWEDEFAQRRGRPPCCATVRGTIGPLRGFFDYLERSGLLVDERGRPVQNPMRTIFAPAQQQRPNDFLRPHEDAALLSFAGSDADRTVIWLLRWTGLRVSEARALILEDVSLTPGAETLFVRTSKTTAGRRLLPIVPDLLPILVARIDALGQTEAAPPTTPLLATRNGTVMTSQYIWKLVKRVAADAGVRPVPCTCGSLRRTRHARGCPRTVSGDNRSRISPHTLRRTFGSDLINRGLRLEVVSKLLGHANTTVTERAYAHLLGQTIRTELLAVLKR